LTHNKSIDPTAVKHGYAIVYIIISKLRLGTQLIAKLGFAEAIHILVRKRHE